MCTWTFIIQYSQQALGGSLQLGGFLLQISLIVFLISRFIMTWVIGRVRATKVLAVLGALAGHTLHFCDVFTQHGRRGGPRRSVVLLVTHVPNDLRCRSAGTRSCNLKFGAAGLVMAIVGGAIMPLIQGRLLDATSPAISFIVPAVCFAVVAAFAVFDLRATPRTVGERA